MRRFAHTAWLLLVACSAPDQTALGGEVDLDAAPQQVAAHADPLSQLDDADPHLAANKRLVFDMWRSIVNAGHVELADAMLQEDYIQHSPVLPTGRTAFKQIFSVVPRTDIPETVSPPLVAMVAEGSLVVMALLEQLEAEGGEPYTTTHFNLFRIADGRLAEHWHSVADAPGPAVAPPDEGGPQPVTGALGPDQQALLASSDPVLAANKRIAFDALRTIFIGGGAGRASAYLAEDYAEFDPNGFAGRELFPSTADDTLGAPLVALVAEDDLVVAVTGREHPHPSRDGDSYTTTRFDMFRISDGKIEAHWSGSMRPDHSGGAWGDET